MRNLRWSLLPLLLVVPLVLAGCTGPAKDAEATDAGVAPTAGVAAPPARGPASFRLEGPTVTPDDGRDRPLREDDGAIIRYTLTQPAESGQAGTALVSFILNGEVRSVDGVTLAPGQSKAFERRVNATELREMKDVRVEVRAGGAVGRAQAQPASWPRPGEWLVMGDHFRVNVDGWTQDALSAETLVRVTMSRGGLEFHDFRSHLLCVGPDGAITSEGVNRPALQPTPGGVETFEMRLPACAGETYGVDFKADVNGRNGALYGRVLFVPKGWTPAAATA